MARVHRDGDPLPGFSAPTRRWFTGAFAAPTPAQRGAWAAAASGDHALVIAPTGSGKTLAAFLWALDSLLTAPQPDEPRRLRVLYVSPLKALAADVERNLRSPLVGISAAAAALGTQAQPVRVGVRTGDTPPSERRAMVAHPPDILITTPESLFLLLTSAARETLRSVTTVIVDEVHAVAGTKRGAHLALSLERLDELLDRPAQRIGLSATVRPPDAVATFLVGHRSLADGGRPVRVVAPGGRPAVRIEVVTAVADLTDPAATPTRADARAARELTEAAAGAGGFAAGGTDGSPPAPSSDAAWAVTQDAAAQAAARAAQPSVWPAITDRIVDLVEAHRSTIVFTNGRRTAERLTARINEEHSARLAEADPTGAAPGPAAPGWHAATPGGLPGTYIGQASVVVDAPHQLARAHHGSMSKEERLHTEEGLKSGTLRAVVATSSLELGIDMGAVDLVIQVGAPPSVASALQRVGRAGHQVGATSHAVWFPTHRADLVPSLVTAERAAGGLIEEIHVPANPLDVLAQQIVAMLAVQEHTVAEVAALARRAAPFVTLSDATLTGVLDMLAGRYPSEDFAELRPRLVWDRTTDTLTARPGALRLAVTSGGTIPDRGMYGVFLAAGPAAGAPAGPGGSAGVTGSTRGAGRRVGELDEEMVYESRVGDVFTLGTSTWRIDAITPDRVLVSPAPGAASRLPFWRGDSFGRPAELGRALGARTRELAGARRGATPGTHEDPSAAAPAVTADACTAANIAALLAEQRDATGRLPDDRTVVIERFKDELGDWRVVVHSTAGARVHAPWALVLGARLRARHGVDVQVMAADDGIVLRLPDTDGALDPWAGLDGFGGVRADGSPTGPGLDGAAPGAAAGFDDAPRAPAQGLDLDDLLIERAEVARAVVDSLAGSAHLAARFREAAARSLLLPRRSPDRRQPLWQQRHRAAQLFAVAARHDDFPVVLEAVRECLRDDYDVPALAEFMGHLADGTVAVVEVTTAGPSPFARSLLLGYQAQFLYDEDAPAAERRAAALTLDPTLLAELVGAELGDLADLLDEEAVREVGAEVALRTPRARARDAEGAFDLIRRLGPVTLPELAERVALPADLDPERDDAGPEAASGAATAEAVPAEADEPRGAAERAAAARAWVEDLTAARRVMTVRVAGREQLAVVEDAGRLRDALGTALPAGLPAAVLEPVAQPLADLVRRHARTRGPFTLPGLAERFGLPPGAVVATVEALVREGALASGRLTPGAAPGVTEYVDADVLRRLRRRSLARLRHQVEAVPPAALAAHLARWQRVAAHGARPEPRGEDGLLAVLDQLAGVALPAGTWETLTLPARVADYSPALLDRLTAAGDIVWVGAGRQPGGEGLVALLPADAVADLAPPPGDPELTDVHHHLLRQLADGGARFFADLLPPHEVDPLTGHPRPGHSPGEVHDALWELAWAGLVTNDTLAPVRALGSAPARAGRAGSSDRAGRSAVPTRAAALRSSTARRAALSAAAGLRRGAPAAPPTAAGRWSLVRRAEEPAGSAAPAAESRTAAARAVAVLDAAGVLVRGLPGVDRIPGGFGAAYQVMRRLEETGQVRRGYLIEGLGGAQFALPEVVDRLRAESAEITGRADRPEDAPVHVLAATDPAQPYGAVLPWPGQDVVDGPEDAGDGPADAPAAPTGPAPRAPSDAAAPRPTRSAGAVVILVEHAPVLYVTRGGRALQSFAAPPEHLTLACAALADAARTGRIGSGRRAGTPAAPAARRPLTLEKIDGAPALRAAGPLRDALAAAGFAPTPRGLRLPG